MSKRKQAAVAAYVRDEYDRLVFQQPNSYVSRNAQADSEGWQVRLCESISSDPDGVREIADAAKHKGFTLIEISIVLVIIGLIIGGVLVGQDLIRAAGERATIAQVEKFNTAVNTFFGKYGYLPGDIPAGPASNFGFTPRGPFAGEGDGNGFIMGANGCGIVEDVGETVLFWQDLTYANGQKVNLIEGSFNGVPNGINQLGMLTGSAIDTALPQAKLGGGNYFYVYSTVCGGMPNNSTKTYYGLSAVTSVYNDLEYSCQFCMASTAGLTVRQAYDIDSKIDDGEPTTGNVIAQYVAPNIPAVGGWGFSTHAAAPSATTCYDTTSNNYSLSQNGGAGLNCGLSFKMQGGD